jgi:hypothetical protein
MGVMLNYETISVTTESGKFKKAAAFCSVQNTEQV